MMKRQYSKTLEMLDDLVGRTHLLFQEYQRARHEFEEETKIKELKKLCEFHRSGPKRKIEQRKELEEKREIDWSSRQAWYVYGNILELAYGIEDCRRRLNTHAFIVIGGQLRDLYNIVFPGKNFDADYARYKEERKS